VAGHHRQRRVICPKKDKNLSKALDRFNKADGVVVYWQIFGTSNVRELKPGELLIEKLLYRSANPGPSGLFKSIVKPEGAVCVDPHWTQVPLMLQPDGQRFSHTPNFETIPVDILSIHHYTYRTESFYQAVKKPRRALWGDIPNFEAEKNRLDNANAIFDPFMLQFTERLKKRVFKE